MDLRSGADGKAHVLVKGKGDLLPLPALASFTTPLTMQLRNVASGLCFDTRFVPPFDKQTAERLNDRAD